MVLCFVEIDQLLWFSLVCFEVLFFFLFVWFCFGGGVNSLVFSEKDCLCALCFVLNGLLLAFALESFCCFLMTFLAATVFTPCSSTWQKMSDTRRKDRGVNHLH